MTETKLPVILFAEDDQDDFFLVSEAFETAQIQTEIHWVKDGKELCDYLMRRGHYCDLEKYPSPDLILLDLNMPRMNGFEALEEIKSNKALKEIPTVVLSTSGEITDIHQAYQKGVNSYIKKPLEMNNVMKMVSVINDYWLKLVALPTRDA